MGIISNLTNKITEISDKYYKESLAKLQDNNLVSSDDIKEFDKIKYRDVKKYGDTDNIEKMIGSSNKITLKVIASDKKTTTIDLSSFISSVLVVKLFDENVKPIYKLNLDLPINLILTIEEMKEYKYKLIIESTEYSISQVDPSMKKASDSADVKYKKVFDRYLLPFLTPPSIKSKDLIDRVTSGDISVKQSRLLYSVECFDMDHVKTSHTLISATYKNTQPMDIVFDLFKKANLERTFRGLRYNFTDMKEIVESYMVTPSNFVDAIKNLQDSYHIFNRKPLVFFDEEVIFLMKRSKVSTEVTEVPIKRMVIVVGERNAIGEIDNLSELVKQFGQNKEDMVLVCDIKPIIYDMTHAVLEENGDKAIIKTDSTNDGVSSVCLGFKNETSAGKSLKYQDGNNLLHSAYEGKEVYHEVKGQGRFFMELKLDKMQHDNFKISLSLRNVELSNIKIFTPILLKFATDELKKYDGIYYMDSAFVLYDNVDNSIEQYLRLDLCRKYEDDGSLAR